MPRAAQIHSPDRLTAAEETAAIVTAVIRCAAAWGLKNAEAARLFDVPPATWDRMKAGAFRGKLDQDKITRASLIVGLFKGLRLLFNGPLATGWPTRPNDGYGGRRPVDAMIEGGIPAMLRARRHIDALRGGM